MIGRRSVTGDAPDVGAATLTDRVRLFEQAGHEFAQRGVLPGPLGGLPGDQAQHRQRHVGNQLGPDRLPDLRDRRRLE